ncbi:MAG TPA: hypothetical protein VF343_02055 [Syntrophales bacterium]
MKKLTDVLREEGLITEEQLREAREKKAGVKRPLQELLVEMGFLEEKLCALGQIVKEIR